MQYTLSSLVSRPWVFESFGFHKLPVVEYPTHNLKKKKQTRLLFTRYFHVTKAKAKTNFSLTQNLQEKMSKVKSIQIT